MSSNRYKMLRTLYIDEKLSMRQIGKKLHRDGVTILYWMKKLNIPRRSKSEAVRLSSGIKPDLRLHPSLAYILGVILGDASCSLRKKHADVTLAAVEEKFVISFKKTLEKIGLHPYLSSYKPKNPNARLVYVTGATSVAFVQWFKQLTLKDVELLISESPETKIGFVRGFFESEGSFVDNRYIDFSNTKKEYLQLVKQLLLSLGFKSSKISTYIRKRKTKIEIEHRLYLRGGTRHAWQFILDIKPSIKNGGLF